MTQMDQTVPRLLWVFLTKVVPVLVQRKCFTKNSASAIKAVDLTMKSWCYVSSNP